MLKNLMKKRRAEQGFTIIEVLIVLAIAGLIIAVVLIAIPQLQRNQRNEARRSVTNRIKTEIDAFSGNNNGTVPVANAAAGANNLGTASSGGFVQRYLSSIAANIGEPKTGNPMYPEVGAATAPTEGQVLYYTSRLCVGEAAGAASSGSARQYVLVVGLEGGATYCVDNR